jgi:hypothetical protein
MYYDSEEVRDKVRIDVMRFGLRNVAEVERLSDQEIETLWDAFLTAVREWWGKVKEAVDTFIEAFVAWARQLAPIVMDAAAHFEKLGITLKELGLTLEPQTPRPSYWREVSRRPAINPIKPIDHVKAGRRMLYHQARRS